MDPGLTSGPGRVSSLRDLSGRILVHTTLAGVKPVADLIDAHASGIIVEQRHRRADTLRTLRELDPDGRLTSSSMPIMRDSAAYRRDTGSGPFECSDSLFGPGLADHLDQQIADGHHMAVTPTRLIQARNDDYTLETVVATVDALGRSDTLCLLPLQPRWLSSEFLKRLDHVLHHADNPIGLLFYSKHPIRDPNGVARKTLEDLLCDHPKTWLLGGDLTVMGAVARYGGVGSMGTPKPLWFAPVQYELPYQDHVIGEPILVPQLLQWLPRTVVQALAQRGKVFHCDCPQCGGLRVHELVVSATARHNVSRWLSWASELRLAPDKPAWWRSKCNDALEKFEELPWDEALRPHHDRLRAWAA